MVYYTFQWNTIIFSNQMISVFSIKIPTFRLMWFLQSLVSKCECSGGKYHLLHTCISLCITELNLLQGCYPNAKYRAVIHDLLWGNFIKNCTLHRPTQEYSVCQTHYTFTEEQKNLIAVDDCWALHQVHKTHLEWGDVCRATGRFLLRILCTHTHTKDDLN